MVRVSKGRIRVSNVRVRDSFLRRGVLALVVALRASVWGRISEACGQGGQRRRGQQGRRGGKGGREAERGAAKVGMGVRK